MLLGSWVYWVEEDRPITGNEMPCAFTIRQGRFFRQERDETAVMIATEDEIPNKFHIELVYGKMIFSGKDDVECYAIGKAMRSIINFAYKRAIVYKPTGEKLFEFPLSPTTGKS